MSFEALPTIQERTKGKWFVHPLDQGEKKTRIYLVGLTHEQMATFRGQAVDVVVGSVVKPNEDKLHYDVAAYCIKKVENLMYKGQELVIKFDKDGFIEPESLERIPYHFFRFIYEQVWFMSNVSEEEKDFADFISGQSVPTPTVKETKNTATVEQEDTLKTESGISESAPSNKSEENPHNSSNTV